MRSFLSGLSGSGRPQGHPLLDALPGQTIIHTRVESRGTWTVTARGWVLHSRIQELDGPGVEPGPEAAVGLRDGRVVGAAIQGVELVDGRVTLTLRTPRGPLRLGTVPRWQLDGPRGAQLQVAATGELTDRPPGPPQHATPEALAAHAASARSGLEERLLAMGRAQWLHPGHVVELLANAGALEDVEFTRRGPILLARLLARREIRAGFVTAGRFRPWDLPLDEVVEHIGTTWTAIGGRAAGPDMIAWFELTEAGRDAVGPRGVRASAPGMSGYDSPGVVGGSCR